MAENPLKFVPKYAIDDQVDTGVELQLGKQSSIINKRKTCFEVSFYRHQKIGSVVECNHVDVHHF